MESALERLANKTTEIETIQDVREVSAYLIQRLIKKEEKRKTLATFNLTIDHDDGSYSNCALNPLSSYPQGKLLMIDDYAKLMVILFTHPNKQYMAYDGKANSINVTLKIKELGKVLYGDRPEEEAENP